MSDAKQALKKYNELRVEACRDEDLLLTRDSGLDAYRFVHMAIPEMGLDDINTSTVFLGRKLSLPFIISSLAGGDGTTINHTCAKAAQAFGMALALGPGRIALEDESTLSDFRVRDFAPEVPVYAQLELMWGERQATLADAEQLVASVDADGLILRLNFFEAALSGQKVSTKGIFLAIKEIVQGLRAKQIPVIVTEVGFGLDLAASRLLIENNVDALSVVGLGGISPAKCVARVSDEAAYSRIGDVFGDWGINVVQSIRQVRAVSDNIPLIAGGGVRHGLDAAKLLALGCDVVSITSPFMAAAASGYDHIKTLCTQLKTEFTLAMFGVGAQGIEELRSGRRLQQQ